MLRQKLIYLFYLFLCLGSLLLSSCFSSGGPSRSKITPAVEDGDPSSPGTDDTTEVDTGKTIGPAVELRHVVDPNTGTFKAKVTIPKNFNGYLYLSGLNISTLSDRLIKVRFKFGQELSSVTLPATVARAEGIIPQSEIQVLVINMKTRPFEKMLLLYDLYDYNSYSSSNTPENDLYDENLYCRALDLVYDPTWEPYSQKCPANSSTCSYNIEECDHPYDKCFYAYAKIRDAGLYTSSGISKTPSEPQIDTTGSDFTADDTDSASTVSSRNEINLKKCLPDNGLVYYKTTNGYRRPTYNATGSLAGIGDTVMTIDGETGTDTYTYKGPYQVLAKESWVLKEGAAIGPYGLFSSVITGQTTVEYGTKSFMFPRVGQMDLQEEVKHLSSTDLWPTGIRSVESLVSAGLSDWMDGCSLRLNNYDSSTNEGIQSCNVTASIEVLAYNPKTLKDEVVQTSTSVKIQLTRASNKNYEGEETLVSSMKSCTSSAHCPANQCCFNKRCWSKGLVSSCIEDVTAVSNLKVGDACTTDYQCSSFCCDRSLGRCAVHDPSLASPVYCSKPPGDFCVAKEWCRQDPVRVCKIIKTGVSPTTGKTTCALRCYNRMDHGECLAGVCVSPQIPEVPAFDSSNPDCRNAESAPVTVE